MTLINLGVVGRPFGIKGEIRVKPHNPYTTWFDQANGLWIRKHTSSQPTYYRITKARRHKHSILLALEGINHRSDAETLRGCEVVAPEQELLPLSEDEYYWYQLIGLCVESEDGENIGEVTRIEETAAGLDGNDVLVVHKDSNELMIPFTAEAISRIDVSQKKIIVNPALGTGRGKNYKARAGNAL